MNAYQFRMYKKETKVGSVTFTNVRMMLRMAIQLAKQGITVHIFQLGTTHGLFVLRPSTMLYNFKKIEEKFRKVVFA